MKVTISFKKAVIDLVDYKISTPDQDQLVSSLEFDLCVDGKTYNSLIVEVRQPMGTDYQTEPLTVQPLSKEQYDGQMDYGKFRDAAENYYRIAMGRFINFGESSDGRMRDCKIEIPKVVEFEVDPPSPGW